MRLILTLEAKNTIKQVDFDKKYHTAMHGYIYRHLSDDSLHDSKDFVPFCFGNLFNVSNREIKQGNLYHIVISSSDPNIIQKLFFSMDVDDKINLGEGSFILKELNLKILKLNKNSIIENITPINLTINDKKIKSIKYSDDKEKYLVHLRENLIRKYNYFTRFNAPKDFDLFSNVEIEEYSKRSEASFPIYFDNDESKKKFNVIGSKLRFVFKGISDEQLKIFQYVFDMGFGERTSFGAGFMVERWKKK